MGANYDWRVGGGMVITNASGFQKSAFLAQPGANAKPAAWVATYASLTLTQWGREFPVQGINSQGLAGILLNGPMDLPSSGGKPQISEQQWLQYQLDRFATVDEVRAHVSELSISPISGKLHYFFCDATRSCAWVDFENGTAVVRDGRDETRSITNSSFASSSRQWNQFMEDGGTANTLPLTYNSLDRFVRATWFSLHLHGSAETILDGLRSLAGIGLTVWHTVFDLATSSVSVSAFASQGSQSIELSEFDRNCKVEPTPRAKQLVSQSFTNWKRYEESEAYDLLVAAAKPAQGFTTGIMKNMVKHPQSFRCILP